MTNYQEIIRLQQKIAPEIIEFLERRYNILRSIYFNQPIGRRTLAAKLGAGERVIRADVDRLKDQGLLATGSGGMLVTPEGEQVLWGLEEYIVVLRGLATLEDALCRRLGLVQVTVVPGDSDQDEDVKKEMGRAAGRYLHELLTENTVVAVTGGSTVAQIPAYIPGGTPRPGVLVVPARGGLGEVVELQASTIAAALADRIGAAYRLLHVPDNLTAEAQRSLANDPRIKEVVTLIEGADILVHGIGRALEMARRRRVEEWELNLLRERSAVGEAFGYYFSRSGEIVHAAHSLGIRLEDVRHIRRIIAVAGGGSKAEAILAVLSAGFQPVLVTDSAAAQRIIAILGGDGG